jgi:hypothetical protein
MALETTEKLVTIVTVETLDREETIMSNKSLLDTIKKEWWEEDIQEKGLLEPIKEEKITEESITCIRLIEVLEMIIQIVVGIITMLEEKMITMVDHLITEEQTIDLMIAIPIPETKKKWEEMAELMNMVQEHKEEEIIETMEMIVGI